MFTQLPAMMFQVYRFAKLFFALCWFFLFNLNLNGKHWQFEVPRRHKEMEMCRGLRKLPQIKLRKWELKSRIHFILLRACWELSFMKNFKQNVTPFSSSFDERRWGRRTMQRRRVDGVIQTIAIKINWQKLCTTQL